MNTYLASTCRSSSSPNENSSISIWPLTTFFSAPTSHSPNYSITSFAYQMKTEERRKEQKVKTDKTSRNRFQRERNTLDFDCQLVCVANTLFISYSHQECLLCHPNIMSKEIEITKLKAAEYTTYVMRVEVDGYKCMAISHHLGLSSFTIYL